MIFEYIEYLENEDENLSNIFGIILSIKKVLIIDSTMEYSSIYRLIGSGVKFYRYAFTHFIEYNRIMHYFIL